MSNVIELSDRTSVRARVAAEVRAEIARAGASQLAVAKATGISQSTLNRKLNPKAARDALDIDELDRIAQVLAVPISKFFATADDDRGPTGGAQSRLGESNPRPSHY
ncbi:helix-turn-helix domain-containing protein, partial [Mycolicibacterium canariasense]